MPTCQEYSELISAYTDHELAEQESKRVEAHVDACRHCRSEMEAIISLKGRTRIAFRFEPVPDGLWDGFRARVVGLETGNGTAKAKPVRVPSRGFWSFQRTIPAFSLGLLLLVMAVMHATAPPKMSCADTAKLIPAYSIGAVSDAVAIKVSAHIGDCPDCQKQYIAYLRQTHPAGNKTLEERLRLLPPPDGPGSPLYEKAPKPGK